MLSIEWWDFNDFDGPLTRFSRSRHFWSRMSQSCYRTLIENHIQSIEWYHFQWPWLIADRNFKVMIFFHIEYLRNGTRQSHVYNRKSIGSHIRSIEWWHFQWRWRTLNPVFKVTVYLQVEYIIYILGTKLL